MKTKIICQFLSYFTERGRPSKTVEIKITAIKEGKWYVKILEAEKTGVITLDE